MSRVCAAPQLITPGRVQPGTGSDKPGPAGSLGKLLASDNLVRIGDAASHLLGTAMVAEASLSFLGFGASGTASWGQLLEQGATFFLRTPHLAVFPSLAMMAAVLSFQMLGDIVRDRIDPRARP